MGPLALAALVLPPLGGFLMLGTMGSVGPWLRSHQIEGLAIYVAGFVVLAGFGLLPTYAQSLLGGWAFGVAQGFAAAILGFGGASVLAYALVRRVAGDRLRAVAQRNDKSRAVYDALLGHGGLRAVLMVALLRLPPNSPFALTNVAMAAAGVKWWTFVAGTVLGMAPRTLAAVVIGSKLSRLDFDQPRQWPILIAGIVVTVLVVMVIGSIAQRAVARVVEEKRRSTGEGGAA